MMVNPLNFSRVNSYSNCLLYFSNSCCGRHNLPSVIATIINNPIQENPVVTPSNNTTVVRPSMINRTLGTVTVLPQKPLYYTVSIAGTASESVIVKNVSTATSSDTAIATVAVAGDAVVITGVAAGTTIVSVFNAEKVLLATIYVTVVA